MTSKLRLTLLTVICVFGAFGAVFAQDDADNPVDAVNTIDAVSPIDDVNTEDVINTIDNNAGNEPPSPEKSSKSKSKSKSKSGKSDESSISITETASAGKSTTEKAAAEGTTLKYKGLVAAGVDINSKENKRAAGKNAEAMASKRVVKGELELSAQPVKKVRAEMGIEYNINAMTEIAVDSVEENFGGDEFGDPYDPNNPPYKAVSSLGRFRKVWLLGPFLTIDKIYAQYNIVDNGQIRAGVMKKAFGLEERAGLDERYFLKRSIINEGLETLGFLDHDLTLAYRHDLLNDALRLTGAFSWSVIDSLAYLQNYSAHYRPNNNMEFILAGIVRHYAANDTLTLITAQRDTLIRDPALLTSFAASLSFRYDAAVCVSEAEVTFGTNPYILLAQNRTALLFGARVQEQFPIDVDTKILRRVTPVVEAALYTADLDSSHTDTQIKAGVTLGFAKNSAFQFRNNFGMIIRTPKTGKSAVRRYRFDSEAVVVF